MSTCNRLDLETLGSQPVMPKNLPDHWCPGLTLLKVSTYTQFLSAVAMMRRSSSQLQMNRLSLRNNWWKFKTARKLPIILEKFTEYTQIQ